LPLRHIGLERAKQRSASTRRTVFIQDAVAIPGKIIRRYAGANRPDLFAPRFGESRWLLAGDLHDAL
jgi:hypothetical protein